MEDGVDGFEGFVWYLGMEVDLGRLVFEGIIKVLECV